MKIRSVVEHSAAPGSHVATSVNDTALITPDTPVARVQLAAFHVTSLAAQVVAPTAGGVNDPAAAWTKERLVSRTHLPPLTLSGPEPRVAMKRKMNANRAASSPPLKIGQVAFGWCIVKYA